MSCSSQEEQVLKLSYTLSPLSRSCCSSQEEQVLKLDMNERHLETLSCSSQEEQVLKLIRGVGDCRVGVVAPRKRSRY